MRIDYSVQQELIKKYPVLNDSDIEDLLTRVSNILKSLPIEDGCTQYSIDQFSPKDIRTFLDWAWEKRHLSDEQLSLLYANMLHGQRSLLSHSGLADDGLGDELSKRKIMEVVLPITADKVKPSRENIAMMDSVGACVNIVNYMYSWMQSNNTPLSNELIQRIYIQVLDELFKGEVIIRERTPDEILKDIFLHINLYSKHQTLDKEFNFVTEP